jgi:multidrug efflux pump subunit AcrB
MTTVVVFLPLIFMSGNPVVRIMFGALGLPLCASLLFSLLVALVFLPAVASRIVTARHPAVERLACWLAPIASIPFRLVMGIFGAVRLCLGLVARVVVSLERGLLAVLTPLRWALAIALLGFVGWKTTVSLGALGSLSDFLVQGIALDSTRQVARGVSMVWIAAALVGAGLLAFGTPIWRRMLTQEGQTSAVSRTTPKLSSFIDLATWSNSALLRWSMNHRLQACSLAVLAGASVMIPTSNMSVRPFGEDESRSQMEMRIRLEDNFTLAEASEEIRRYETILQENQEQLQHDHISCRFDSDGGGLSLYWDEPLGEEQMATVRRQVKELFPPWPGHELRFYGDEEVDTRSRTMVVFQLLGPDAETLGDLGQEALRRLENVPGIHGLESPLQNAPRQVRVALDVEKSWQLGVTADIARQNIAWALRGFSLPRFHEPGREVPFFMEYDEEEVAGLHTLRDLSIYTTTGSIALASVADMEFGQGPRAIRRHNGRASYTITGRVDDPNQQLAISEAGYAALREMDLPRGFSLGDELSVRSRQDEELEEMRNALMFSVVLVFLLMSILFESLIKPFAVLFTIPFAMVGALWTLYLTGTTMDSVGWIGLIILVGVVVNNGIVLIDRIDRLHVSGMSRFQAVLEGGASRVRPILMTALTTIFGLLPMVLSEPPPNGIDYRALGTCVAGGLAFSTIFTLWVVPLSYTLVLDLAAALHSYMRAGIGFATRGAARITVRE